MHAIVAVTLVKSVTTLMLCRRPDAVGKLSNGLPPASEGNSEIAVSTSQLGIRTSFRSTYHNFYFHLVEDAALHRAGIQSPTGYLIRDAALHRAGLHHTYSLRRPNTEAQACAPPSLPLPSALKMGGGNFSVLCTEQQTRLFENLPIFLRAAL